MAANSHLLFIINQVQLDQNFYYSYKHSGYFNLKTMSAFIMIIIYESKNYQSAIWIPIVAKQYPNRLLVEQERNISSSLGC